MKVCIKGNEFNINYHEVFGEDKAKADGYTIFEVPKGFEDCSFEDFDNNGFNQSLYDARKTQQDNSIKIAKLKQQLANMDYKGQKYLDGEYTEAEWAEIKVERKTIREQIRNLESKNEY